MTSLDDPNVLGRLARYQQALQDISYSPLIGIGFGRFNDLDKDYSGVKYVAYIATSGEVMNEPTHAHNSYLHFWAEGGLVGLTLMMGVWVTLFSWVRSIRTLFPEDSFGHAFARGIEACIVLEFLVSFTEHSMGTAVSSLTVFSLIGLLRNIVPKSDSFWKVERSDRLPSTEAAR